MKEEFKNIGHDITQSRQAKGITLEQLSQKSKISVDFIKKIEQGEFGFLPDVYVKSFIKTIASILGLNPDVYAERFEKISTGVKKEQIKQPDSATLPAKEEESTFDRSDLQKNLTRYKFYILVISFLALFIVIKLFTGHEEKNDEIIPLSPIKEEQAERKSDTNLVEYEHSNQKLNLVVSAIETTWVRIVFQDSLVDEAIFLPKDIRSWESEDPFYLRIGNGGGVRLKLNGKELGVPSKSGQVSLLKVDKNGMSRISQTEFPNF